TPTTNRLTADRSITELLRNNRRFDTFEPLLVILLFIEKSKNLYRGFLGPIHM
ncbi:hypothetical protein HAX54_015298, partial [Datura stramonium]|nr:hypothetical protein [Datura stramonium]